MTFHPTSSSIPRVMGKHYHTDITQVSGLIPDSEKRRLDLPCIHSTRFPDKTETRSVTESDDRPRAILVHFSSSPSLHQQLIFRTVRTKCRARLSIWTREKFKCRPASPGDPRAFRRARLRVLTLQISPEHHLASVASAENTMVRTDRTILRSSTSAYPSLRFW